MSHYFLAFTGFLARDYKRALRTISRCNEPLYLALYKDGSYRTFIMSDVLSAMFKHEDADLVVPIYTDVMRFRDEFMRVFEEFQKVSAKVNPIWLVEYQNNEYDWWYSVPRLGSKDQAYSWDNGKCAQGAYAFTSFTQAMSYVYAN